MSAGPKHLYPAEVFDFQSDYGCFGSGKALQAAQNVN
jgi:hypothetical protein